MGVGILTCRHGAQVQFCPQCMENMDAAIDAIARRRFERHTVTAKRDTWDWLPAQAKRQWIEEAAGDLTAAMEALRG